MRLFFYLKILLLCLCMQMNAFAQENIENNINESGDEVVEYSDTSSNTEKDTNQLRTISASRWGQIKKDKAFKYSRNKEKNQEIAQPLVNGIDAFFNSGLLKVIMFLLIGLFVGVIIYHLFFTGDGSLFKYRKRINNSVASSYEDVEKYNDWDVALRNALQEKNYRLAIRVLYLQTLQQLNKAGSIQYEVQHTNWVYVQQMTKHIQGQHFKTLTRNFDYVWYGGFTIDENIYTEMEKSYRNFQGNIQ